MIIKKDETSNYLIVELKQLLETAIIINSFARIALSGIIKKENVINVDFKNKRRTKV